MYKYWLNLELLKKMALNEKVISLGKERFKRDRSRKIFNLHHKQKFQRKTNLWLHSDSRT